MSEQPSKNVLDGKYEVVKRLASGGMSEVYLVRHVHLEELRVIKVLRPESAADPSAQARFLRAARMATQIKHPNVAILYDSARLPDNSFYMVWEYISGEDVGHWVERRGPFPLQAAIELAIQGLRGLEAIHSHGVIHRDISPDNLMLTRDHRGRVRMKIIDLGLAKNLEAEKKPDLEVTQAGMFMGKLRYCSPEQAGMVEGAILDRRTDLYSFAAVFYEMLCGQAPFESETPHGYVFKRLTEEPLPLVGRAPGVSIPRGLEKVVLRGLERDRDERFATAVEFIEALEEVLQNVMQVSTQEMPSSPLAAGVAAAPSGRSSSQLSRQEKDELLAQIHSASKRVAKTRPILEKATRALGLGRLDEVRRLIAEIEAVDPRTKGLVALREGLAQAEREASTQDERLSGTETMLQTYLDKRQSALARLAFATLLELAPEHPKREEYETRLEALESESALEGEAAEILARGRAALARGDYQAAEAELEALRGADPSGKHVAELRELLDRSKAEEETGAMRVLARNRFAELLAAGDLDGAETELESLSRYNAAKVTLDLFRSQLADARRIAAQQDEAEAFEGRFRESLEAGDWIGAREVVLAMDTELRGHPRTQELFAELEERRHDNERRQAVAQGERQLESLLAEKKADQAAVALKVLLKLAPNHPRRRRFEDRIAALRA